MLCDSVEPKNILKGNPLFFMVLPLMVGVVLGSVFRLGLSLVLPVMSLSLLLLLAGYYNVAKKWLFGVALVLFMFSTGAFVELMQRADKSAQWSPEKMRYKATLVETPLFRGTDVKVLADVSVADTIVPDSVRSRGLAYLYLSRDLGSDTLEVGDVVFFENRVIPIRNSGNPAEFDVERYYYVKGITGNVFLYSGTWTAISSEECTLFMSALALREKMVRLYGECGFSKDAESLLSALTLGEKRDFPKDLKDSYSKAGASHVLALSGLHLGIFYMLLLFLLPFNSDKLLKVVVRELFILFLLWAFAFVAGLSPSIVRAALLFTMMSVGRCLCRDTSSLNSLACAAIVMLLYDPHLLFDVSFQLSFAAVISVLLLASPLRMLLCADSHGVVYKYVVGLIVISFAAQVGTFPFIWYYFGIFPLYFLMTNFFVVPMAFVVMSLAIVLWCLAPFPLLRSCVAWMLGWVADGMNSVVVYMSRLQGASFELPPADVKEVVIATILLLIIIYTIRKHRLWFSILTISLFVLFVSFDSVIRDDKGGEDYLLFYNNRKNPLVHAVATDGTNYLVSSLSKDNAEYEYVTVPYIRDMGLNNPVWVSDDFCDSLITVDNGLVSFAGTKVRLLDHGHWRGAVPNDTVDVLLLCRGFLGEIDELVKVYPADCLVLDASLYQRSRKRILRECNELDLEVIDLSSVGAVKVVPNDTACVVYYMKGS